MRYVANGSTHHHKRTYGPDTVSESAPNYVKHANYKSAYTYPDWCPDVKHANVDDGTNLQF